MSGPSIYLRGMREVDGEFYKMIAVRDACWAAGVELPKEVMDYFGDPDQANYELKLQKFAVNIIGVDSGGDLHNWATDTDLIEPVKEDREDSYMFDIHLDRLPTALKTLRLEISW